MDLADSLLSEELRSLQRRRWSGVLALSSGEVTKGLFLREGRIVFAASNRDEDKLGETLFRKGRISRDELDAAFREAQGPSRRIGHALIRSGVISKDERPRWRARSRESYFRCSTGRQGRCGGRTPIIPWLPT